jgi:hypothetical protein
MRIQKSIHEGKQANKRKANGKRRIKRQTKNIFVFFSLMSRTEAVACVGLSHKRRG